MSQDAQFLTARDGTPLGYRSWRGQRTRAVLAVLHGLGGHCDQPTYRYLIDHLVAHEVAVFGLDLRGHGTSGGRPVHVDDWSAYLSDVDVFVHEVTGRAPDAPLFLLGQSLGGLIALEYAMTAGQGLAGVIASSAALAIPDRPRAVMAVVRILDKLRPTTKLPPAGDLSDCTRDPAARAELLADPGFRSGLTARLVSEIMRAIPRVQAGAARMTTPVLLIVGTADPIADPAGSRTFFEHVGSSDRTFIPYEGSLHQPMIDLDRDIVIEDITTWIEERA